MMDVILDPRSTPAGVGIGVNAENELCALSSCCRAQVVWDWQASENWVCKKCLVFVDVLRRGGTIRQRSSINVYADNTNILQFISGWTGWPVEYLTFTVTP